MVYSLGDRSVENNCSYHSRCHSSLPPGVHFKHGNIQTSESRTKPKISAKVNSLRPVLYSTQYFFGQGSDKMAFTNWITLRSYTQHQSDKLFPEYKMKLLTSRYVAKIWILPINKVSVSYPGHVLPLTASHKILLPLRASPKMGS